MKHGPTCSNRRAVTDLERECLGTEGVPYGAKPYASVSRVPV